ncbi:site-specific DNA-methyltransferase [Sphingomonas sp. TREG-RG-20F-R18-01]|uniref:site-specific DNA-methyltransferase n=1 Tax=Sphingomonas sp. TREG-RG-20F-R18-01 TaxID=2914982 RepID=UPI001F58CF94|nr:site-specific DNA-methyltransferase [Sphingomonas sp. TREG-RG-20F-R18-01]
MITLHEGDNRDTLRRLIADGVRVHSVVCDPPYGMTSITKRFGKDNAAAAKFGSDGAFKRASAGFMGSKWDGTGIERDPEFWALIYDILLPGGYCVAFSAARTGHWQACAMEMGGFVMHPFLGWIYGSGFPKAHNAAMAIDRELGAEAGFIPTGNAVKRMIPGADQNATGDWTKTDEREYQPGKRVAGSPEAAQWQGWAYGGQALKPALEPIFVGQKPFSEKNGALNLLKHGVGAINIDGCRVATDETITATRNTALGRMNDDGWKPTPGVYEQQPGGRHPANLLHDGSDEVVAMFPAKAGAAAPVKGTEKSRTGDENTVCYGEFNRVASVHHGDTGSAARFFNSFPLDADPVFYQAKATKADRAGSKHPTVKPVALMQWLVRLVTPPNGTVLDPFAGSGTTAEAARREGFDCILMEAEAQFAADIRARFGIDQFEDLLGGNFADLLG